MSIYILFRRDLTYIQNIGRQIIFLQVTMIISILVLFFLHGLDSEELEILFPVVAPVTSLYLSIAVKLLAKENIRFHNISNLSSEIINRIMIKIKLLTWGHYLPVILLITLKSLFPPLLNFTELLVLLALLESFFGFSIGELLCKISELRIKFN